MSEIPDEVVERVAKAIFDAIAFTDGVAMTKPLDAEGRHWLQIMARAALLECGWAEMKEALDGTLKFANEEVSRLRSELEQSSVEMRGNCAAIADVFGLTAERNGRTDQAQQSFAIAQAIREMPLPPLPPEVKK